MSFKRAKINDFWTEVKVGKTKKEGFSDCWEYTGSPAYLGYRAFRSVLAHRAAAVIYCGKIPSTVRQRCGNKMCVRVCHLNIKLEVDHPSDNPKRRNILTFKEERPDLVKSILDARGESGKYKFSDIATKVGTTVDRVKKILREAALYDLLNDREQQLNAGFKIRMEPYENERTSI